MNRRTMDIVNLICRQSLSAFFQKLNNNNPSPIKSPNCPSSHLIFCGGFQRRPTNSNHPTHMCCKPTTMAPCRLFSEKKASGGSPFLGNCEIILFAFFDDRHHIILIPLFAAASLYCWGEIVLCFVRTKLLDFHFSSFIRREQKPVSIRTTK